MKNPQKVIYHASRLKWLGVAAICAGFTIGGYFMLRDDPRASRQIAGYFVSGFFGLGLIVAVANLIPGATFLRLDSDGFTMCSMWRSHTYRWEDISHFGITSVATGHTNKKMVGFSFIEDSPRRPKSERMRNLNMSLSGFEAALPDDYGQGYEKLATELSERLLNYKERK
jgi:hypothetical protein